MFKFLSNNKARSTGVRYLGAKNTAHQIRIGRDEWQGKFNTMNKTHFTYKKYQPPATAIIQGRSSQIQMQQSLKGDKDHFKSEAMDHYRNHGRQERVKPRKTKLELMASTYSIGMNNKRYHKTTFTEHFYDNLKKKPNNIQFKRHPHSYHILTGRQIMKTQIDKASAFDKYKEDVHKKRISRDVTILPKFKQCIVTGRRINY